MVKPILRTLIILLVGQKFYTVKLRGITEDGQTDKCGAKHRRMCHKKILYIALTINAKDDPSPHTQTARQLTASFDSQHIIDI